MRMLQFFRFLGRSSGMMATNPSGRKLRFGLFLADLQSAELYRNNRRVKLQHQAFQVLKVLLERPGELVTRDDLKQRPWPATNFGDIDVGLNGVIKKIRDALGDSAEHPLYIETRPKLGYRFIALVEEVPSGQADHETIGGECSPSVDYDINPVGDSGVKAYSESQPNLSSQSFSEVKDVQTLSVGSNRVQLQNGTPVNRNSVERHWKVILSASAVLLATLAAVAYFHFGRKPKVIANDTIVLADFANSTGDPVFDETLGTALIVALRQMTAQAGAILNTSSAWDAVDWRTIEDNVRRLQARIVKAVQQKKWNKVKALQHLLTHSASGKLLAVRRVTVNDGRKTPGVDGELWDTPHKKLQGVISLTARGYRPMPLRRIYIPKANGKLRPLGIPTMRDRAMQALYLLALDPVAETTADQNSYGFRQGRSCADAIEQCFTSLCHKNPSWVLEGDIKGCFDNISHQWLLDNVPLNKAILHKWLESGYLEKQVFYDTISGTPQGGIISPVLSNLTLDGLECRLRKVFPVRGKGSERGRAAQVHLIRYADDFIITGHSEELLRMTVKPLVESFLAERGLVLSSEKTLITHIEKGFDFLGQNIRRYPHGKLFIRSAECCVCSRQSEADRPRVLG
jgi:group II intron reverse transcriptase/maturase